MDESVLKKYLAELNTSADEKEYRLDNLNELAEIMEKMDNATCDAILTFLFGFYAAKAIDNNDTLLMLRIYEIILKAGILERVDKMYGEINIEKINKLLSAKNN